MSELKTNKISPATGTALAVGDSGDTITVPSGATFTVDGTLTLSDGSIANAKLANMAANTVKVRDANSSGVPSDKALATTEVLIGDGTGFTAAALSGDVTMANTGAVTIATDAVDIAMLSATGTASATTFLRGDNAWSASGGGLDSVQAFSATATWTKPSDITKVRVELVGGGGGGTGANAGVSGAGGGGGGYTSEIIDVSAVSTVLATIGAGGAGGADTGGYTAGATGGTSSFGSYCSATGGVGGTTAPSGGDGGLGADGTVNIRGAAGGASRSALFGAHGGDSMLGGGAGGSADSGNGRTPGVGGFGGGGGGANNDGAGGAGLAGLVIVWEYK